MRVGVGVGDGAGDALAVIDGVGVKGGGVEVGWTKVQAAITQATHIRCSARFDVINSLYWKIERVSMLEQASV